jgi:hypothetical protein
MNEGENAQLTGISKANSLEEIADFWDTHNVAEAFPTDESVNQALRLLMKIAETQVAHRIRT